MSTKISKTYVEDELGVIAEQKRQEWREKNPGPESPTPQQVIADLQSGSFSIKKDCLCEVKKRSASRRGPVSHRYHSEYDLNSYLEVGSIKRYNEQWSKYEKDLKAMEDRVRDTRKALFEQVYFNKYNFIAAREVFQEWDASKPALAFTKSKKQ